ncbi:MAG: cysteine--tRNA ligase [Lactobacillales bacterium]|jgi:cysteinyl-tRNA synthetase|nr:cysteine--tRNA ligase [Lactobacillales bacterium]
MKIYNTLTRQKEEFRPIEEGKVRMYVCGPTVYNYIHIGNARSIIAFDVIRRYLEYRGFEVEYVSNFTDVDDKIICASVELGISAEEVANRFIETFNKDIEALNVRKADQSPRVSDYIPKIIDFINVLVKKDWAYESNGDVYFRVQKFPSYGKLSNQTIEELEAGAGGRVGQEQERKEDVIDFALWKKAKENEPSWESPWGIGRPGWHIECSVMATMLLGETIDIHGGGQDLEFPHHTNEIAQSEAKTGKKFVNYWLHNGFVTVGEQDEKMSKSLGNFVTVHELLKQEDSKVIRFLMGSAHYRRPIRFSKSSLEEAKINVEKLKNVYDNFIFRKDDVVDSSEEEEDLKKLASFEALFVAEMDDDFNSANGMSVLYELAKWMNMYSQRAILSKAVYERAFDLFVTWLSILGIEFEVQEELLTNEIEELISERNEARLAKNFDRADEIRDLLKTRGILLEDTAAGIRWKKA